MLTDNGAGMAPIPAREVSHADGTSVVGGAPSPPDRSLTTPGPAIPGLPDSRL